MMDINEKRFEFFGRKTGLLITVYQHGDDDYSAWWMDETEKDNELAGFSVRGTKEQILDEIKEEI